MSGWFHCSYGNRNSLSPDSVIHSSPRRDSGIPMATSLWTFSVRNMWTPRPNSEKCSSHSRSFTCSTLWHTQTHTLTPPLLGHWWWNTDQPPAAVRGVEFVFWARRWDGSHLVAVGPRLVLVEGRHQSLTVHRVPQNLLLDLLLVWKACVVVEGVVRGGRALRGEKVADVCLKWRQLRLVTLWWLTKLLLLSFLLRNMDCFHCRARSREFRLSTSSSRSCSSISWKAFLVRMLTMTGLGSRVVLSAFSIDNTWGEGWRERGFRPKTQYLNINIGIITF